MKEVQVKPLSIKTFLFAGFVLVAMPLQAFNPRTDITELEWREWPDFCKVAYLRSDFSYGSRFKRRMDQKALQSGYSIVAQIDISGPHHFCVGLILYHRAVRGAVAGEGRRYARERAIDEFRYSYERMDERNKGFSLVADYYGRSLHLNSNRDAGYDAWSTCIELRPEDPRCYVSMADALLKDNEAEKALQVLQSYPKKDAFRTHEFLYAEARILRALGRIHESRVIAEKLVGQGYPAKSLLDALQKAGKYENNSEK